MAPVAHSLFSASSSYRLLACPGSYDLGQKCDPGHRRATIFSAEGTLAHSLAEAALHSGADLSTMVGRKFGADGFEFEPDETFIEAVQVYVDFVRSLQSIGYNVLLETRVSPSIHWQGLPDIGIELFGTADCIAHHPGLNKLVIADLKFGRGIAVEVAQNPQFLYYAAGAINPAVIPMTNGEVLPPDWRPAEVETIVIQPRAAHPDGPIRHVTYTADEVIEWSRTVLHTGVLQALTDGGKTLSAGDHCRFCPALAHCPAQEQAMKDAARAAFADAPSANVPAGLEVLPDTHISDEKLGELLDKIALIKPYMTALETLGEERLKAARPVKGWKLVPTRTRRIWAGDDQEITAALTAAGLPRDEFTDTVILTPAQLEKRLGKKRFKDVADGHVVNSTPGVSLAPEGDPRARVLEGRSAREAFGLLPK